MSAKPVATSRRERWRNCEACGQPMLPKGAVKKPEELGHARGCPRAPNHELKTWEEAFRALLTGEKRDEFRKDDSGVKVGDGLRHREMIGSYTSREREMQ